MMSEKRFKTKYYLKSRQGVVLGVVKVNEEDNVLHWNEVVDLLNSLTEENEQLKSYKLYEDNKRLQSIIADLKKENEKLKKQVEDCRDYNAVLYKNCVQKDRRWLRRIKRVEDELEESIKENARLRELVVDE